MTNPPIIDSTMFLPYTNESGVPRRRRISISNGQIGQIVNHEAFYVGDDLYDDLPDLSPYAPQPDQRVLGYEMAEAQVPGTNLAVTPQPGTYSHQLRQRPPAPIAPVDQANDTRPVFCEEITVKADPHEVAGVPPPNHLLIYNNEVIYNPNNGPIPGTAAWKKERLLERNRIAASKCRQRKKHAQKQLQDNVSKYESQMKEQMDRLRKCERLLQVYNAALTRHFSEGESLEGLRKFVNKLVDDMSFTELH